MLNHYPDDAPASQHWKTMKEASFSLIPAFRLICMSNPTMNMCSSVWCTNRGELRYASGPIKTSLQRTFHLTGLTFRRQHLLLSSPLLGFRSPFWKITQLIPHLSLFAACLCFRPSLCGTKHLFIFSECLAQRTFPEQPLQQVHTANEDNSERRLDSIPLNT